MSESENKKSSWKLNLVMLWFSQLLVMAGFSAMIPFIPLFLKDELMVTDKHDLALYITLFNFFGTMAYAIFVPIWGFLSDRFGVKPMLLRGTFVDFRLPNDDRANHAGQPAGLRPRPSFDGHLGRLHARQRRRRPYHPLL